MKPVTVRGSHKISFHNYNLLTLITLNTRHRHIPIVLNSPPPFYPYSPFFQSDTLTPYQAIWKITLNLKIHHIYTQGVFNTSLSCFHCEPLIPLSLSLPNSPSVVSFNHCRVQYPIQHFRGVPYLQLFPQNRIISNINSLWD